MSLSLPSNLIEGAETAALKAWIAALPATLARLRDHWSLSVLGEPYQPGGRTAWVAPASRDGGGALVLKAAWRHPEAEGEAEGLRCWDGDGAVEVFEVAVVDNTIGLLLERCDPGTPLATRPEQEQDVVISGLLRRLWVQPPRGHGFRSLQAMCDLWADEFEAAMADGCVSLDPGMARAGIALFRALPASAERSVLLCTDLHAGNVLAAEREPWLVIDPKPYVGDPTYDPLQHMLNCRERLGRSPHDLVARMSGLLDLDQERLRLWLFARCVQESRTWPELAEVARLVAPA